MPEWIGKIAANSSVSIVVSGVEKSAFAETLRRQGRLFLSLLPILPVVAFGFVVLLTTRSVFAADAVPGEEHCDGPIDEVTFEGNHKTLPRVLEREMLIFEGDPCSLDEIVDSTQNIQDLRLFSHVAPRISLDDGKLVLTYVVKEKIHFLPLPRFSRTSDGELRYGLQLRWDNFAGRHHQFKITAEKRQEDDGQGNSGQLYRASYEVPRFFDTNTGLSVLVDNSIRETDLIQEGVDYGVSEQHTDQFSLNFNRWLTRRGATRGFSVKAGFTWTRRHHTLLDGELGPFSAGRDLFFTIGLRNRHDRDDLFRLRGFHYGWTFNMASRSLGSDFSHYFSDFYFVGYKPMDSSGMRNFNYRVRLGYSNGAPFGEKRYHLGGGDMHRGLAPGSKDGEVLTLLNLEYLVALDRNPQVRWVVFADIGNTQDRQRFDLFNQKFGAGVGMRYKVLRFSNTDIRIDVANSRHLDGPRVYLSTDLTF